MKDTGRSRADKTAGDKGKGVRRDLNRKAEHVLCTGEMLMLRLCPLPKWTCAGTNPKLNVTLREPTPEMRGWWRS